MTDKSRSITRRDVLKGIGAGIVGSTGPWMASKRAAQDGSSQDGDGWPMFGHDAANTGHAPNGSGPLQGVNERWRRDIEDTPKVRTVSVVNNMVFVSTENSVLALDARNGDEIWESPINNGVTTSPSVVNATVYVGGKDSGKVYALESLSGRNIWEFEAGEVLASDLAVVDESIYFNDRGGRIHSLDADTGGRSNGN